jgi:aminopeptidase YwaD
MPLIDPDGSRRALQAEIGGFNNGSDHQIWSEGSFRIPAIYIADWPDRYIHTTRDLPENLDPTKLRRAIFIAAASGYALASVGEEPAERIALWRVVRTGMLERAAAADRRAEALRAAGAGADEIGNIWRHYREHEAGVIMSLTNQSGLSLTATEGGPRLIDGVMPAQERPRAPRPSGAVYRRVLRDGPMSAFGYSWFDDRLARAGLPRPRLLAREPDFDGPEFAYETLNLVDGRRSIGEIRDDLAASVGAAPVEEVAEYLATLARLGVIEAVRP